MQSFEAANDKLKNVGFYFIISVKLIFEKSLCLICDYPINYVNWPVQQICS